ncbi:MAG: endonuclease/exonuclease/phosphatase family protein [Oscillospiraceae bacterium]|nr:endonuclease/exonuclease/phosphatase family protein [Oscillospiraceae bacterium]
MKNHPKRTIIAALVLVPIGAVLLYAAYVFLSWHRVEDNLPLDVDYPDADCITASVEKGTVYRVVSYNIGFGAYSDDYSFFMDGGAESRARSPEAVRENVAGAMDAAMALDPDFLLLQEVDVDGTRSHHIDELALVKEAWEQAQGAAVYFSTFAQNYDSPYLLWPLTAPHGANRAGLAVLSRHCIDSALRRQLPIEEGFMKLVDLDRCYSVQRIPITVDGGPEPDGRELVLYNLHLSAYTSDGTIAEEQLKMLFADMRAEYERGNWTVAGGDFNKDLLGNSDVTFGVSGPAYTWAQPIPAEIVPEALSIVVPFDAADPKPSCRNADRPYGPDNFLVTVDGFIVSANVSVTRADVWDTGFRYSDHNPVYMDFVLD